MTKHGTFSWLRTLGVAAAWACLATAAAAQDWGGLAAISSTMGANKSRICVGEGNRQTDLGCPSYAPSLTTSGDVSVSGNLSATKFLGDGSLLTGVGGTSDRITSGTSNVTVNSATSTISFTTNGSVANYVDSSGRFVMTGISTTTNQVSFTTGYFSGNVGIGTTAPGSLLQLATTRYSDTSSFRMTSTNSGGTAGTFAGTATGSVRINPAASSGLGEFAFYNDTGGTWDFWNQAGSTQFARVKGSSVGMGLFTSGTERVRVDSSGNVGIGTTAPSGTLHVAGSQGSYGQLVLQDTQSGHIGAAANILVPFYDSGSSRLAYIYKEAGSGNFDFANQTTTGTANLMRFLTGSTPSTRMVIDGSGNVGIGTTAPSQTLHVAGDILTTSWTAINFPLGTRVTPTAPLEVSGTISATALTINGTPITGAAAPTDRISSTDNYSMVVANPNPGTVSFTLGNTAGAAYLHPTLGFVGPGVSTTGPISGTAGYFSGNVGIGTTAPSATLHVNGTSDVLQSIIRGSLSQTLQLTQWQNSAGSALLSVLASGAISQAINSAALPSYFASNAASNATVGLAYGSGTGFIFNGGNIVTTNLQINNGLATQKGLVIKGAASQSGNLQEWQNSSGAVLSVVSSAGNVGIGTATPTAALSVSGDLIVSSSFQTSSNPSLYVSGSTGNVGIGTTAPTRLLDVAGIVKVQAINIANSNSWFGYSTNTNYLRGYTYFGSGDGSIIDSITGKVGIGTTAPSTTLTVSGSQINTSWTAINLNRLAVTPLEVSGTISATALTINGVAIIGGGGATDRISSTDNYSMVVANPNPGTVSFTLGNTAGAAYLHPTLGFVGPGVSTTGPISGTAGYFSGNVGIGTTSPGTSALYVAAPSPTISIAPDATFSNQTATIALYARSSGTNYPATISSLAYGAMSLAANPVAGANSNIAFTTAGTQRMIINYNGSLGMGTSLPIALIHLKIGGNGTAPIIVSTSNMYINLGNGEYATNSYRLIGFDGSGNYPAAYMGYQQKNTVSYGYGDLIFGGRGVNTDTAPNELMRITGAGNVGIGTQTPTVALQVSGDFVVSNSTQAASAPSLYISATSGNVGIGSNAPAYPLYVSGTGNIFGVGNVSIGNLSLASFNTGVQSRFRWSTTTSNIGQAFYNGGNGYFYFTQGNSDPRIAVGGGFNGEFTPSRTIHVSGTVLTTSWTGINFSSASNVTPTAPLEVSGTISATAISSTIAYHSTISTTSLYVNGVAVTGAAAPTDRISSTDNYSMVVANPNPGTVSFTLGNTAGAAYLHPTLGFVGPGVSTTGGISGTTGYFSGNVGIGTTAPHSQLEVVGTGANLEARTTSAGTGTATALRLTQSNNPGSYVGSEIVSTRGSSNETSLTFVLSNGSAKTTRMVIDGLTGNVGIGTTSPSYKVDVNGNVIAVGTITASSGLGGNVRFRDDTGTVRWLTGILGSAAATDFSLYDVANSATRLTINSSTGNVGIGTTAPSNLLQVSGSWAAFGGPNSGVGYTGLAQGNTTNSGYLAYFDSAGSRHGYTGYSDASWIYHMADSGYGSAFGAGGTTVMVISNTGVMDIGSANVDPSYRLKVEGTGLNGILVSNTTAGSIAMRLAAPGGVYQDFYDSAATGSKYFRVGNAGNLVFESVNDTYSAVSSSIMALTSAGNVGIGTTAPMATLQVSGSFVVSTTVQAFAAPSLYVGTNGSVGIGTTSPAVSLTVLGNIRVGTSGTNGCVQQFAGTALTGTCASDEKLKKNIASIDGKHVLERLALIKPSTYEWRSREFPDMHLGTGRQLGLIAQQVEKSFPELVETDDTPFKKVKFGDLPIYLLQGIRELKEANDTLVSQTTTLKAANDNQQHEIDDLRRELNELKRALH